MILLLFCHAETEIFSSAFLDFGSGWQKLLAMHDGWLGDRKAKDFELTSQWWERITGISCWSRGINLAFSYSDFFMNLIQSDFPELLYQDWLFLGMVVVAKMCSRSQLDAPLTSYQKSFEVTYCFPHGTQLLGKES